MNNFLIENNFNFDNYHQFDLNTTYNCQNSEYSYMPLCPNICGYISTMKVSSFINVNLYRENLGKNGMSAIYGGDDGLLLYDLLIYFYQHAAKSNYERNFYLRKYFYLRNVIRDR